MGNAPTLSQVNKEFGEEITKVWLMGQLRDLNEFASVRKMNETQILFLSETIMAQYHWLKLSEIMLFLFEYKNGTFGEMYGVVDPQSILARIRIFITDVRNKIFEDEERAQRERKEMEEKKRYEECLANREQLRKEFKNLSAGWFKSK